MEYKKIEHLVYNQNLINPQDFYSRKEYKLKLDKMLIDNLQKCIDRQVPVEIDELEFAKVYKIYLKLLKNKYIENDHFITNLSNITAKKLDYLGIIQEITE